MQGWRSVSRIQLYGGGRGADGRMMDGADMELGDERAISGEMGCEGII